MFVHSIYISHVFQDPQEKLCRVVILLFTGMITFLFVQFTASFVWTILTIVLSLVFICIIIFYPNDKNPTHNTTLARRGRNPDRENHQSQEQHQIIIIQDVSIPSNQTSHHLASDHGLSRQTDPVALRDGVLESSNR